MKISNVDIVIDYKTIKLSEKGFYLGKIYFQADNYIYPDINSVGNPLNIMRWLLREMRLLIESKHQQTERHIYFHRQKQYHIYLNYLGDNLVSLEFSKIENIIPINNDVIFTAVFSKKRDRDIHTVTCKYSDLFEIAYNEGNKLFNMFNVEGMLQGGEMLPLEVELKYSKRIINRIKKNNLT